MENYQGIPAVYAPNREVWRGWLEQNAITAEKVWLIIHHKSSKVPSVYYDEAVEEALCFGWVDSKPNKRDSSSYYLYFSRRKPSSKWSAINKERVSRLIKLKKMTPLGMKAIAIAKQNQSWFALDDISRLVMPLKLKKALSKNIKAQLFFDAFPASTKRGIYEWISAAKRAETRQKRIDETVSLAEKNIRANQYVPKSSRSTK